MPLSPTRTPPQRSFGRRPGPSTAAATHPTVSLSAPPAAEAVETAQPARNWLSEITAQAEPAIAHPAVPANAPPMESQAGKLTARGIVLRSLAVMGRNPVTFLALIAAAALSEQVVALLSASAGLPGWTILPLLTTMGCMALYAAAFHTAMSSLKGERVNFDLSLRAMAATSKSAYGVIALTVSSLSLLLILPAIGFAWRWVLAAPVAMVEGGDARTRSALLARSRRTQIRLLVWLLAGLSLLRALLVLSLSPDAVLAGLMGDWLFPMLLTVLTAVMSAVLYREAAAPGAEAAGS